MPCIETKQAKSTTTLPNLPEVVAALRCDPDVLAAFICLPLGTTYQCCSKSGIPRWSLKAAFAQSELQQRVSTFCAECVVCPRCGDCGTRLYVRTSATKRATRQCRIRCGACGADSRAACQESRVARLLPDESELRAPLKLVAKKVFIETADTEPPTSSKDEDEDDPFADFDFSVEAIRARAAAAGLNAADE